MLPAIQGAQQNPAGKSTFEAGGFTQRSTVEDQLSEAGARDAPRSTDELRQPQTVSARWDSSEPKVGVLCSALNFAVNSSVWHTRQAKLHSQQ